MPDFDAYFKRIGCERPGMPTVAALRAVMLAHVCSVPFENVDVLLRRAIHLDETALFDKIVTHRRGGYCFEQNGLLLAVLERLGFTVETLRAGVRLGKPDRAQPVGHTHLALKVTIDGEAWLADVGVGAASLTAPLRLVADVEQSTPHDIRRLRHVDGRWFHQIRQGRDWVDVYEFGGEPMHYPDRVIGNWYTSTHPESHFRDHLNMALARRDGTRISLKDGRFTVRRGGEILEQYEVADNVALLTLIKREFGMSLPASTLFPEELFT